METHNCSPQLPTVQHGPIERPRDRRPDLRRIWHHMDAPGSISWSDCDPCLAHIGRDSCSDLRVVSLAQLYSLRRAPYSSASGRVGRPFQRHTGRSSPSNGWHVRSRVNWLSYIRRHDLMPQFMVGHRWPAFLASGENLQGADLSLDGAVMAIGRVWHRSRFRWGTFAISWRAASAVSLCGPRRL